MSLADWPAVERPRERLLRHGVAALSDAELLAVFLRTGTADRDAVELARTCLASFRGLGAMLKATQADFCAIPGLGPARYAQLQAVVEMSRRSLLEAMVERPLLTSPDIVRDYLTRTIGSRPHEVFMALLTDAPNNWVNSRRE